MSGIEICGVLVRLALSPRRAFGRVDLFPLRRHSDELRRTALRGASAGAALKRNSLPSRHIACIMHDDGELARHRHTGLLEAMLLGNLQPPGLQAGKGEEWRPHEDGGQ